MGVKFKAMGVIESEHKEKPCLKEHESGCVYYICGV